MTYHLEKSYLEMRMATFNLRAKDQGSVRLGTKKYAGFNIKSSKQLLEKLELVLGYTPVNNDGKPSVAKDALKELCC